MRVKTLRTSKAKPRNNKQQQFDDEKTIYITTERWKQQRMGEKVQLVQKLECINLNLYANYYPNILKQIKHIAFNQLEYLNLWGNHIVSIEGITRIKMNNLKKLGIWDNKIISIRDLRKSCWPALTSIDLKDNKIQEYSYLTEVKVEDCSRLHIDFSSFCSSVAKMQAKNMRNLRIDRDNLPKIDCERLINKLRSKYFGLQYKKQ